MAALTTNEHHLTNGTSIYAFRKVSERTMSVQHWIGSDHRPVRRMSVQDARWFYRQLLRAGYQKW